MSAEENKRIVGRSIKEILTDGDLDRFDELLAPNNSNPSVGATNREALRAAIAGLVKSFSVRDFAIEGTIAEGDSVVIWGRMTLPTADEKKIPAQLLTRYRLANGQIVEDGPFSTPPLTEVLAPALSPKPATKAASGLRVRRS